MDGFLNDGFLNDSELFDWGDNFFQDSEKPLDELLNRKAIIEEFVCNISIPLVTTNDVLTLLTLSGFEQPKEQYAQISILPGLVDIAIAMFESKAKAIIKRKYSPTLQLLTGECMRWEEYKRGSSKKRREYLNRVLEQDLKFKNHTEDESSLAIVSCFC